MDWSWNQFERELRREKRRIVATAIPYPALLLVLAAAGALVLYRAYPLEATTAAMMKDLQWIVPGAVLGAAAALGPVQRWHDTLQWYRTVAALQEQLAKGSGLSRSMAVLSRGAPGRMGHAWHRAVQRQRAGYFPERALEHHGCPRPIVQAFARSTSEEELAHHLGNALCQYSRRTVNQLGEAARFAPSCGVAAAGVVLLWVLIRVVVPVLTSMLRWEYL